MLHNTTDRICTFHRNIFPLFIGSMFLVLIIGTIVLVVPKFNQQIFKAIKMVSQNFNIFMGHHAIYSADKRQIKSWNSVSLLSPAVMQPADLTE